MATPLTVNNKTFQYPTNAEDPSWGEDATAWAQEVTSAINTLLGTGSITETDFTVPELAQTDENVTGLTFNGNSVRAGFIEYSVYRINDTDTSGYFQSGMIEVVYDTDATGGSKWNLTHEYQGDALIDFDITDGGQITYTSLALPNSPTTGYFGKMTFKARTITT